VLWGPSGLNLLEVFCFSFVGVGLGLGLKFDSARMENK